MRKTWLFVVALGLGCAGTGEPEPSVDEFITSATPPSSGPAAAAPSARRVALELLPDADDDRWTSTHHNLTLQVDDPSAALAKARSMFLKAGAQIQSANRQPNNASINATMSPKVFAKLSAQLEDLQGKVVYENTSTNAMGPQTRQLRDRLALAHRADGLLGAQTKHASGDELDALMLLHELNARERTNLENQIRSYWDQAGKTYVYLTFQLPQ